MTDIMVKAYVGQKGKQGDLGLEFECEGRDPLPMPHNATWTTHEEGSLRGFGMEYVTNGPINMDQVYKEVEGLVKHVKKEARVLEDSPRTSWHIHKNVGFYVPNQLHTAICAYWLLEPILMKYCGPDRERNMYCLQLKHAEGVAMAVKEDYHKKRPFAELLNDQIRYGGQNVNAIPKYCSLEYRGMRGTYDPDVVYTWANVINTVHERSKGYANPQVLMDRFFIMTPEQFVDSLLPEDFIKKHVYPLPNWKDLLDENMGVVSGLAYYHDWDAWQYSRAEYFKKNPVKEKKTKIPTFDDVLAARQTVLRNDIPTGTITVMDDPWAPTPAPQGIPTITATTFHALSEAGQAGVLGNGQVEWYDVANRRWIVGRVHG